MEGKTRAMELAEGFCEFQKDCINVMKWYDGTKAAWSKISEAFLLLTDKQLEDVAEWLWLTGDFGRRAWCISELHNRLDNRIYTI